MEQVAIGKEVAIERITTIFEALMPTKPLFQEALDSTTTLQTLSDLLLAESSPEDVMAMPADDLKTLLHEAMVLEAVSGTLNELTPEQMEIFDAAVTGR